MQLLLIADSSEIFTQALAYSLGTEFDICICQDGNEALEQLNSCHPDAMIIQLSLPFRDGLTVMQEAAYLPPVIVPLSNSQSTYIDTVCLSLGAALPLRSPTLHSLTVRLFHMLQEQPRGSSNPRMKTKLLLRLLNFDSHRDGYEQICTGMPLYLEKKRQKLSMELYPAIAAICHVGDTSVEHSIRNAIEKAWAARDPLVWEKYFPGCKNAPHNKAFFARLAEILEDELP